MAKSRIVDVQIGKSEIAEATTGKIWSPTEIAHALRGECYGDRIRCPGPGHSVRDRSLEVLLSPTAPDGFITYSFARDDFRLCRDHVRAMLGMSRCRPGAPLPRRSARHAFDESNGSLDRRHVAQWLWSQSLPAQSSPVESYLVARGIRLSRWPVTIRYLPAKPPAHPWPAMIAAFGRADECEPGILKIASDAVVGVHLTYLQRDGSGKAPIDPAKRSIGRGHNMPIVLAPPNDGLGLIIAEGIENAISLHVETGLAAWASGGAGRLPALADAVSDIFNVVTVVADDDSAGRAAACALVAKLRARKIGADHIILK